MLPMARVDSNALVMPQVGQQRWCLSSHMSTAHLLATTTLLHALHRTATDKSTERVWQAVMSNFADHAALKALPGYKHPALLQLALLWEHWHGNFDIILDRFSRISRLHTAWHAPCAVPYSVPHADGVLIGAWNPML